MDTADSGSTNNVVARPAAAVTQSRQSSGEESSTSESSRTPCIVEAGLPSGWSMQIGKYPFDTDIQLNNGERVN